MLTVDFDRLGLRPGDRVLDMGCGAGRHAFEVYRRGGDVGELEAALERLLDDPDRRARMGAAGRERALAEFSWRAVAEATAATYQQAVDARRRADDPGPGADRC